MMCIKICFAIFFALYFSTYCRGQVEIDYSDIAHEGDGYIYAVKKYGVGELKISDLDRKGWNVSDIKPDSYDTVRYYSKNRSKYGNLFPNSELVKFQTKKNMEFLTIDSSKVRMQGIINDYLGLRAAVVLVFPTDLLVYKFPLKKGLVVSDSISKNFVSSYGLQQFADSVRIDLEMKCMSVFDTCISIATPTGTYQALREINTVYKKIVAYKNSHLMGWRPAPEFGSRMTSVYYRWYAKGSGIAVMEVETDERDNVKYIRYQYHAPMTVKINKEDVRCKGKRTGKLEVVVDGGTPDYKYVWSNGKKGRKLDSLYAGTYSVTVTDCKGNVATQSVTITEPSEELSLKIDYNNIRCYGDHDAHLKANVNGGTSPYYIVWSNDTEAPELVNQGTGVYGCIVRDANRCFVWDSVEITAPKTPFNMSPKVTPSPCFNEPRGIIEFDISGGDAPYNFWLDDKPSERIVEGVMAGKYTLRTSDKWGCEITRSAEVRQPSMPMDVSADVTHVKCAGGNTGSIVLKVTGGTPGFKYSWSNGAESRDIARLKPGNYYVTVSDVNKCEVKKTYTVNAPASILKAEYTVTDVRCKGGNTGVVKANGVGGVAPYEIMLNGKPKTAVSEGLTAGNYNLKITDSNGCTVIETIIVSEPEEGLSVEIDAVNTPCKGKNLGKVVANVSNGTPPYRYIWENGDSSPIRENIPVGRYSVRIVDSDKCEAQAQAIVNSPEKELVVTLETNDATTIDAGDGMYSIKASGGVPPYNYKVSDGSEVQKRYGIRPGKYTATVSDNAGCVITKEFEINTKQ